MFKVVTSDLLSLKFSHSISRIYIEVSSLWPPRYRETYLVRQHLGPGLLGLLLVDMLHENTLVLESVTLGLQVQLVIQVAINLLGLPEKKKCYIESEPRRKNLWEHLMCGFSWVCKQLMERCYSAANSTRPFQAQITWHHGVVNVDRNQHLYLLSSLLRTRILMIHMVFWEVLASLVPLRLPKPVCLPFLRASSFLRTRDLLQC